MECAKQCRPELLVQILDALQLDEQKPPTAPTPALEVDRSGKINYWVAHCQLRADHFHIGIVSQESQKVGELHGVWHCYSTQKTVDMHFYVVVKSDPSIPGALKLVKHAVDVHSVVLARRVGTARQTARNSQCVEWLLVRGQQRMRCTNPVLVTLGRKPHQNVSFEVGRAFAPVTFNQYY